MLYAQTYFNGPIRSESDVKMAWPIRTGARDILFQVKKDGSGSTAEI